MADKLDAPTSSSTDAGSGPRDGGNSVVGGPKAIIKNVDMSEELQQESVDIASAALEKYNIEKDIAAHIKKEFDRRHGPTWHVVVGKNFGSYVTHGKCHQRLQRVLRHNMCLPPQPYVHAKPSLILQKLNTSFTSTLVPLRSSSGSHKYTIGWMIMDFTDCQLHRMVVRWNRARQERGRHRPLF